MDKFTTGIQIPNTNSVNARNPDVGYVRVYGKDGEVYARYPDGTEKQLSNVDLSGEVGVLYEQSLLPTTTNSTIPVRKLLLQTPNLPLGEYVLSWGLSWNLSQSNREFIYGVLVNGTEIHTSIIKPSVSNLDADASNTRVVTLSGNNQLEIVFSVSASSAQATVSNTTLILWKVS